MSNRVCATCGGTGWQILDRSWFPADGFYRAKCGICEGTGRSNYRDDPKFVKEQARRRETAHD